MNHGWMRVDNNPKTTLKEKVINLADYYRKRFGRVPNLCYVNPAQYTKLDLGVLQLRPARNILPHHFWIGIEE